MGAPPLGEHGLQLAAHEVERLSPAFDEILHVDDLEGVGDAELCDHLLDPFAVVEGFVAGDAEHRVIDEPVGDDHEPRAGLVDEAQCVAGLVKL